MNAAHGKGVATLLGWLNASVERDKARGLVDGLTNEQLADVLDVVAAAHLAEGNKGAVLLESAAARLRGVDVEVHGSRVEGVTRTCGKQLVIDRLGNELLVDCALEPGHRGAHARVTLPEVA